MPSVASSGSWTSKTCVTSQPPSPKNVTSRCGLALCARASRRSGHGIASSAPVVRPTRSSVRRDSSGVHFVLIVASPVAFSSVEDDARAAQHGGEEPAPRAFAGGAGHLPGVGTALGHVVVEVAVEPEPALDLRRVCREALPVEAPREPDDDGPHGGLV